jgi:hypothetical protein
MAGAAFGFAALPTVLNLLLLGVTVIQYYTT